MEDITTEDIIKEDITTEKWELYRIHVLYSVYEE